MDGLSGYYGTEWGTLRWLPARSPAFTPTCSPSGRINDRLLRVICAISNKSNTTYFKLSKKPLVVAYLISAEISSCLLHFLWLHWLIYWCFDKIFTQLVVSKD